MGLAQVNGQALNYDDTGGDQPVVLFSHGFLMDGEMFAPQVRALRDEYRVVTWDWRGFGRTETDGLPFTVWDQANDLIGLLDYLHIGSAVLCGMSHGGYIAMRAALLAPDRVRALILLDTNASGLSQDEKIGYRHLFSQWVENGPTEELTETFAALIIGDTELNEIWKSKWKASARERIKAPGEATVGAESILSRLPEITCPAVVMHGADDVAFPLSHGHDIATVLPGSGALVVVPGGHAANLTHPERVNIEILRFRRAVWDDSIATSTA